MSTAEVLTGSEYIQHHLEHVQLDLTNFTLTNNNNGFWVLNLDTFILRQMARGLAGF